MPALGLTVGETIRIAASTILSYLATSKKSASACREDENTRAVTGENLL
jgi:hypothetical protein